ncbi:MAG: response regulator, partial [Cyclobacteriaceae bacterium]|nr:response regulator [Cyclobacteriaceae bacterium]
MSNTDDNNFYSVMLIDDNEIDNLINQKMIEAASITQHIYTHTGARSAIEFLRNIEKLEEVADQILPDVIFLDIDMPLMDGFQFLD